MLKDAWKVAIEALSWIEMQKLSEQMALSKTIEQLQVENPNTIRYAYRLVCETIRRKNQIDEFIKQVIKPETLNDFNLGLQLFLRLYVYQTRSSKNWTKIDLKEAEKIAKLGRTILGLKTFRQIEHVLGFLLTQELSIIFKKSNEIEK